MCEQRIILILLTVRVLFGQVHLDQPHIIFLDRNQLLLKLIDDETWTLHLGVDV